MKRYFYKSFVVSILSLVIVVAYQNCGQDVSLQTPASEANVIPMNPRSFGEFCAPEDISIALPQKIFIILDMSASNLYRHTEGPSGFDQSVNDHRNYYYLGQDALDFCLCPESPGTPLSECANPNPNPSECRASDMGRVRFTAIEEYLNSCPQNQDSDNLYAVIGFSTFPLKPFGFQNRSCEDQMTNKATALAEINGLRQIQISEDAQSPVRGFSYPFKEEETSYMNAFNCMESRIMEDMDFSTSNPELNPASRQREYKVLFLTDGAPSDRICADGSVSSICPTGTLVPNSTYISRLQAIKDVLSQDSYSFVFQPIYYGFSDFSDQAQFTEATNRLNEMSAAINNTPGINTIAIDPSSTNFSQDLRDDLCNTPVVTTNVNFQSYAEPQVIPLTALQMGTQLYDDSDMDGIPDVQEDQLAATIGGYDKTMSRSNGKILDSLCLKNRTKCQEYMATNPTCDQTQVVGFGFSACDQDFINKKILDVDNNEGIKVFDGLDYDNDDLLDYVELIKGLNMFLANDANVLDDGDAVDGVTEILRGTDPQSFSSAAVVSEYSHSISFSELNNCSSGRGFSMSGSKMPIITNLIASNETYLTPHDAAQNVFAILYFAKPAGMDNRIKPFVRYLKVRPDQTFTISDIVELPTMVR
jgi:hypothetical protein